MMGAVGRWATAHVCGRYSVGLGRRPATVSAVGVPRVWLGCSGVWVALPTLPVAAGWGHHLMMLAMCLATF
jgi:hypothetical protein